MNGQEQAGIDAINGLQGTTNAYLGQASGLAQGATQAVTPGALNLQQFENPYQSDVINATMAQIANQNAQQRQGQTSSAISAGAFGGDRAGVAQAALANQQDLASNATLAGLNSSNYTQALAAAQQQQGVKLSADTSNRDALATGSQLYSGLGSLANSTGLANAGAQLQGGILQQQTQQASDTANYNQFENQQAYPFQTAQFLAGITGSLAPELGGTSSGTQQQSAPSPFNSIIGGGLGLAGILSDRRAKEAIKPIGKSFDGQTLYSFRYKGEPDTHVGYLAQEVEKSTPDAVGERADGMKVVDYAEATRKSAEKGHFARGGRTLGDLSDVRMYANGGVASMPYADATGYVPTIGLAQGRAPQQPGMTGLPSSNSPTSDQSMSNLMTGAKQFGSSSLGQGLGDSVSDFAQDHLSFARGGQVIDLGLARAARGYDGGGVVPPDPLALTFDPNAVGDPAMLGGLLPGPAAAPSPDALSLKPPVPVSPPPPVARPPASGLAAAENVPPMAPAPNITPVVGYRDAAGNVTPAPGLAGADASKAPASGLAAIDKAAPVSPDSMDSYYGRVRAIESRGGDNSATSPAGATGAYQIMPATWADLSKRHPDLGLTPDGMRDAKQQDAAVRALTADNTAQLKSALGRDPTPAELYLAHQQGAGGAISMLTNPNARAGDLVGDKAIAMNGGDPNMKAGDFASMWSSKFNGAAPASALAFAGTPATAGSAPAPGLATAAPAAPSSFSDNFGSVLGGTGTPTAGHTGGMLGLFPGMSDDTRMGLAAAGFGMAASGSRSVGQALGQGGLEGVKQYQALQKLGVEKALGAANVANLQSQTADRPLARAQGEKNIELRSKELQAKLAEIAATIKNTTQQTANETARTNVAIPAVQAETYAKTHQFGPQGVITTNPSDPKSTPTITPYSDMPGLNGAPPAGAPPSPSAPSTGTVPAAAQAPAATPAPSPTGYVPPPARVPVNPMLFSQEGKAQSADLSKTTMEGARNAYESSQSMKLNLEQMQHEMAALPSTGFLSAGPGQQQRAALANQVNSVLRTLGVDDKNLPDGEAIGATEKLKKLTNYMGFDLAKSLGGREPGFIVQQSVGAVPSSENSPMGAQRLIGGLRAVAQRQEDRYTYLTDWAKKSGGDLTGADDSFNKSNPPSKYVGQAVLSTVPPTAAAALRQHPEMRAQFDAKFGSGTSRYVLGQ